MTNEITNKYERTIDGVTYDVAETMTPKAPLEPVPLYPMAKRWERAAKDGRYWFIDDDGYVLWCEEKNDDTDDARYQNGNYYRSEREAEHVRDTQVLMNQIQRWRDCHDPVELGETFCCFYFYFYNYTNRRIEIEKWYSWQIPNVTYFSSKHLVEQCLAAAEDNYIQTYGERLKALYEQQSQRNRIC